MNGILVLLALICFGTNYVIKARGGEYEDILIGAGLAFLVSYPISLVAC